MRTQAMTLGALAVASVLVVTGCATTGPDDAAPQETVTEDDIAKAMETPTTIEYWSWLPDVDQQIAAFEAKYPEITVNHTNVGAGEEEYTKIRTALKAGDAPDVFHVGQAALPSFAADLLDLAPYGAAKYEDDFLPSVWGQVVYGDAVLGMPIDVAPMAAMYRADLLDQAGVEVPETWDEYAAAAAAVKESSGAAMTILPSNDMGEVLGLLWAAGVKPFGYDGAETIRVSLDDPRAIEVMEYWNDLMQSGFVDGGPHFTDAWYRSFADSQYASWLPASWGPRRLMGTAQNTSGLWTLAPLPTFDGVEASGLWGGSATAVLDSTKNPIVAAEFARFMAMDEESVELLQTVQLQTPALSAGAHSTDFLETPSEFFGGEMVNQAFVDAEATVDPDFEWLPYMSFVASSYNETLGKAIAERTDLVSGLEAWQDAVMKFGEEQGFTVER